MWYLYNQRYLKHFRVWRIFYKFTFSYNDGMYSLSIYFDCQDTDCRLSNCQNTDCQKYNCQNTDCQNTRESTIATLLVIQKSGFECLTQNFISELLFTRHPQSMSVRSYFQQLLASSSKAGKHKSLVNFCKTSFSGRGCFPFMIMFK